MAHPRCKYFGKCGGCTSQNIDYSKQVENKVNELKDVLKFEDIKVFTGDEYGYRNRMDFSFHRSGLGFRMRNQWYTIIEIKECPIASKPINTVLGELNDYFKEVDAFDLKKCTGTFRYAVIRSTRNSASLSFVLNAESSRIKEATEKIQEFAVLTSADSVIITYVPKNTDMSVSSDYYAIEGNAELQEDYLGKKFSYNVQGFFQNNHSMAEHMHKHVRNILKQYETQWKHLLDLYGGVGTFGIVNADLFESVISVESLAECTKSAKDNMNLNEVTNMQAHTLDATKLHKLELPAPLFVITDPPRSGMHTKTIRSLMEEQPEVIIYISCNVKQLKKELTLFRNYAIKSAALFDFFPQTPHSEAVIELVRKD